MRKSQENTLLSGMIKGNIVGSILLILTSIIFSFVLLKGGISRNLYFAFLLAAAGISAAIGGFAGTRARRKSGIASGLLSGTLPALLLIIAMSAAYKGFSAYELIPLLAVLLGGMVGGIAAVNKKAKKKKIKR